MMINDNSSNASWPKVSIIGVEIIPKSIMDNEPYQQKLILSCGHWLYNTYGNSYKQKYLRDIINCRNCFLNRGD